MRLHSVNSNIFIRTQNTKMKAVQLALKKRKRNESEQIYARFYL